MALKKEIRIKPSVKEALIADTVITAQVAKHMGIVPWTLRYSWLSEDKPHTVTPALIYAISKYLGIKESEVTEEFSPINETSSVL